MNSIHGPIGLVELHDAWVAGIHLRMGGEAAIDFSHLAVYHEATSNQCEYDIWSYKARLELQGVKRFDLLGGLGEDDSVSDDNLINTAGTHLRCEQLIGGAELARLFLSFSGSGATLSIECGHAQLHLLEPLELVEKWIGPL